MAQPLSSSVMEMLFLAKLLGYLIYLSLLIIQSGCSLGSVLGACLAVERSNKMLAVVTAYVIHHSLLILAYYGTPSRQNLLQKIRWCPGLARFSALLSMRYIAYLRETMNG